MLTNRDSFFRRIKRFLIIFSFLLCMGSSCFGSTDLSNSLLEKALPQQMTAQDMMRIYGAIVRANYRQGTRYGLDNPKFLKMEEQLQKLGHIPNAKTYEEIEQGIVYNNMPFLQVFAALDDLKLVDTVSFEQFTLSVYEGKTPPIWNPVRPKDDIGKKEVVFVCNQTIIGLRVLGQVTFETSFSVEYSKTKIRTNFPPNYFDLSSPESMKYMRKGYTPAKYPVKQELAVGGWQMYTDLATGEHILYKQKRFSERFEASIAGGRRYKRTFDHLEKIC